MNDVEDCTSFRAPLGPNRDSRPPVFICNVYLKCGIRSCEHREKRIVGVGEKEQTQVNSSFHLLTPEAEERRLAGCCSSTQSYLVDGVNLRETSESSNNVGLCHEVSS